MTNKKIIWTVFLVISFAVINLKFADAHLYSIAYKCMDNICVEGRTAEWNVTIHNHGNKEVEYTAIELLDEINDSVIAGLKVPFSPLSSKRGNVIVVNKKEGVTVNFTGKLPKANYWQSLVYYPCFTTTITDSYIVGKYGKYESRECYKENLSMPIVQCILDNNCGNSEYCRFNVCLKLNCGECQYIENHTCLKHECCNSEQCGFNEICKNNLCGKLNCSNEEYIENRTCKALNCGFDEAIFNKTCKKLNCSYEESAFNHTCMKLECKENEFIEEHKCKLLNCNGMEHAENHTCKELNCLDNEIIFNHKCTPSDCYFFQEVKKHACADNKSFIFKSIFEAAAVAIIIIFLALDVRKYKAKQKN